MILEVKTTEVVDSDAFQYDTDNSYDEDDYQYEDPFDATVFM